MKTAMRSAIAILILYAAAAFAQEPTPTPAPPETAPAPQAQPAPAPVKPAPAPPTPKPEPASPAPKPQKPVKPLGESVKSALEELQLPERLDELIEQAQESSPDIRIAEAQLREAQAKLQQAQLKVAQEITKLYGEMGTQKEQLDELVKGIPTDTVPLNNELRKQLNDAQATLSEQLANLRVLVGSGAKSAFKSIETESLWGLDTHPRPKLADMPETELQKVLTTPVSIEFEDQTLTVIADYLSDYFSISIVVDPTLNQAKIPYIKLDQMALSDAFLAIADMLGNTAFIVRPSYIFATTRENAQTINAPCIPDYLPLYVTPEVATQLEKEKATQKY